MRVAGPDGGPFAPDAWVRLVSAIAGVLDRYDAVDVSPQQTRALRALSRLFTTHGVTVHVERDGRRVFQLGEPEAEPVVTLTWGGDPIGVDGRLERLGVAQGEEDPSVFSPSSEACDEKVAARYRESVPKK